MRPPEAARAVRLLGALGQPPRVRMAMTPEATLKRSTADPPRPSEARMAKVTSVDVVGVQVTRPVAGSIFAPAGDSSRHCELIAW